MPHFLRFVQDYAIRKMDGVNLDGQRIMCEMAKEFPDRRGPRVGSKILDDRNHQKSSFADHDPLVFSGWWWWWRRRRRIRPPACCIHWMASDCREPVIEHQLAGPQGLCAHRRQGTGKLHVPV